MVRYKMLARDVNSNPTQYRTWIVADNPDLQAQFYYGYKSGNNPLVDISAYAIDDDTVIAGFDLPLPTKWNPDASEMVTDFPIRKVLPGPTEDSSLAIIDGYAYLFGGRVTNKIWRASLANPADWTDTGATLPTELYGSSLAVVDGYIYLFGGNDGYSNVDGYSAVDTIFSAPISDPLQWTNHGSLLPHKLQYSSLGMYGGELYLFGGRDANEATSAILSASTSNPLVWTDTGQQLPAHIYGSSLAQIDGYWMMYGGQTLPNISVNTIYRATVGDPIFWRFDGYLPYPTSFSQFFTMGDDGYLIGSAAGQTPFTGFTPVIQCNLATPNAFIDVKQYVRGQISHSNLAIIYDRVWLFGGSGETAVFACNQMFKYGYYNAVVQAYAEVTRVIFPATDNLDYPFQALCIPYWKTDYSMYPPPTPPSVPPLPPPPGPPPFPPTVPQPPYI